MTDIRVKDLDEASVPGTDYYFLTDSATDGVKKVLTTNVVVPVASGVSGLGTGVATFLATPSSANLASALTDETGSGAAVFATSPTLVTPTLGAASATSINKVAVTAPATSATLTIADGKTLTASDNATVSGTNTGDQTITLTGDVTGTGTGSFAATIGATKVTSAMLNADVFSTAHSWSGQQTFVAPILGTPASGNLTNCTAFTLTTTGTSGAATYSSGVLNIPQYSGGGGGLPTPTVADAYSTIAVKSDGSGFQIMKRTVLLPDDFGWVASDTLANRHAAMVAWAADPGPGQLDKNTDYEIDLATGSLLVAAGKIIEGNGALIYDTATHGKLLTLVPGSLNADTGMLAGGWQIGDLRLQGAFVSTYDSAGFGIYVTGTDNVGSGTAPVYVESFLLDNVSINDVANSGIWEIFTDGGIRRNVKMQDIGYTGLMALSCRHHRVVDSRVVNLGPGTSSNAYGFAFTRNTANNLTTAPRSSDCVLDRWFVKNNPIWHAADTHAGEGIKILNGRAEDVFRGINVGYDADGANAHGARNCLIKNNTLLGIAVGATQSSVGIMHTGYPSATDGYSTGCVIEGNHIQNFGDVAQATFGGAFIQGSQNVRVQGNSFIQCRSVGISFAGENYQSIARDNYVEDSHSDTLAGGIGVFSTNNEITFGPNSFRKTATNYGTSNMPYRYLTDNSATFTLSFEGGDQATGLAATHSIGANVVVKRPPIKQTGKATAAIAAGTAAKTVVVTFAQAFTATPTITGISGPSYFDTNEVIYGFTSLSTTQVTLTVRTVDGTTIGATGGNVEIHWAAEGW